jgi:hypothetical protein
VKQSGGSDDIAVACCMAVPPCSWVREDDLVTPSLQGQRAGTDRASMKRQRGTSSLTDAPRLVAASQTRNDVRVPYLIAC